MFSPEHVLRGVEGKRMENIAVYIEKGIAYRRLSNFDMRGYLIEDLLLNPGISLFAYFEILSRGIIKIETKHGEPRRKIQKKRKLPNIS